MLSQTLLVLLLAASLVQASPLNIREVVVTVTESAPTPDATAWNAGAVSNFPIHESCNATEHAQLKRGLSDAVELAQHAQEHLLRWGNQSEIVRKYFGKEPGAEAIGWFASVVSADRGNMTFRCDDPDGNCAANPTTWAGHWRGSNATQETVICPLSYERRLYLEQVCSRGYNVANSPLNTYWGVDLLHRIFHVPQISLDIVSHYAEDYPDVLKLAETNSTYSARDSDTLQYFAIEAYAYDIAVPGKGCPGEYEEAVSSTTAAVASATPTPTATQAASTTTAADASCHTHADGVVHCGSD